MRIGAGNSADQNEKGSAAAPPFTLAEPAGIRSWSS
jgi:hypothetical protein